MDDLKKFTYNKELDTLATENEIKHSTPFNKLAFVIVILLSGVCLGTITGSIGYYWGLNSSIEQHKFNSDIHYLNQNSFVYPTIDENIENHIPELPKDWIYKSNNKCNVNFAIPPKKEPYYYSADPDGLVKQSPGSEVGSGRFWDFPRGSVFPNLLSKLPTWDDSNLDIQAVTMFASPEEASGYVAQAVVVSCISNFQKLSNSQIVSILSTEIAKHNESPEDKGMQPSKYTIREINESQRWGRNVLDLLIDEDGNMVEYTIFGDSKYIYEVKVWGETKDYSVKQVAREIFDLLKFEN